MRRNLYLLVPDPSTLKWKAWHKFIRQNTTADEILLVHSRHLKLWTDVDNRKFDKTIAVKVSDRTTHRDPLLLDAAAQVNFYSTEKFTDAASILLHYLFNMNGYSYRDEARWADRHGKRARALAQKVTKEKDHGWELEELRKHGILDKNYNRVRSKK